MKQLSTTRSCYALVVVTFFFVAVKGKGWGLSSQQGSSIASKEEEGIVLKDEGYDKLVEWMISHGGRVDQRMSIGVGEDGIRGMIATADIPQKDTELLFCPWKLVLGSSGIDDVMTTEQDMCNVVKLIASEYRLGSNSMGWPYLSHIEPLPRLGAMWEGQAVAELQGLLPSQELDRHYRWFSQNCGGGDTDQFDDATIFALTAFISRSNEVGMTPIYDLLNHHNGLKNAKLFLEEGGVLLKTVQPIAKGQQLFLSYGIKAASQMYRDYGFVESWPTLWSWKDASTGDNHVFALFSSHGTTAVAIHPSPEFLKEIWKAPAARSLSEWQQKATQYTRTLDPSSLQRFVTAGQVLLNGLPTSFQQDEVILQQKMNKQQRNNANATSDDDIIAAIQYRLDFKRAVHEAMLVAKEALLLVTNSDNKEEL